MKAFTLAAILLIHAASAAPAAERLAVWEWQEVPRVVAVGDLHGAYDKLVQLLTGAGLVDGELRWSGGEDHLVAAGDLIDRGTDDRAVMDLLRRLQQESEAAGGRVHVLLGNHEALNLLRETAYVNPASYRAFADEERKEDRKAAWRSFLSRGQGARTPGELRVPFDKRFPRGFFGRQRAFDRDGEYGGWLLEQPVMVKINGVVYLHGGLTESFAGLGLDGINRQVREALERHLEQREVLLAAGVLNPTMSYGELMQAAEGYLGRKKNQQPERSRAAQGFLAAAKSPILGGGGPLWYRGTAWEDERIERDQIERSLELLEAQAMAVAHSYTGGNRITSRFLGRVFRLDHGIFESEKPLALVVESGRALVLDPTTHQLSAPVREPPNGLAHPPVENEVADLELERFLAAAPVVTARELGRGSTRPQLVVLEMDGHRRRGIFKRVHESGEAAGVALDRYQHEVAAYRLDRRLGLGMVPVTVVRDLGGLEGSLQLWVEGAVDKEAAAAYELELYETEATAAKLASGKVFDALIGNRGRQASDVLCLLNSERVYLIDHSRAFPVSAELDPAQLEPSEGLPIPPELDRALRSLDRESLAADLGALLDERQIDALLERRDQLLGGVAVAAQ